MATKYKMTDKERILFHLMRWLARPSFKPRLECEINLPWVDYRKPQKGDLVICNTSGVHLWTVSYVVDVLGYDSCLLKEIGGDRLCTMSNESFYPIRGIKGDPELLEGAAHDFYLKVLKAFRRGDEHWYRFGGIDVKGKKAIIWIRERYGGGPGRESIPFCVEMEWNTKTTIKHILETLRAGGYGTKEFEVNDNKRQPNT